MPLIALESNDGHVRNVISSVKEDQRGCYIEYQNQKIYVHYDEAGMFRNRSDFSLPKQKVVISIRGGEVEVESAADDVEVEIINYDK